MSKPFLTDRLFRNAVQAAANEFGVEADDICSRRRSHTISLARHAAVAALIFETQATYTDVAQRVQRDHTTVLYAVQTATQRAVADPDFANGLAGVMSAIRAAA